MVEITGVMIFDHHFLFMSTISIAKLYLFLTEKFGAETSENLTTFIEEKMNSEMENNKLQFATKADVYLLKEEIAKVEGRLSEKIASADSRNIKWMFIFWIGQMTAIILLFLRK